MPLGITCSHSSVFHTTSGGGSGLSAFPWQDFLGGFLPNKALLCADSGVSAAQLCTHLEKFGWLSRNLSYP